jgi:hypothetical protein
MDVIYHHHDDAYDDGENDMPEHEGTELSLLKTCLSSHSEGDSSSSNVSSAAPLSPASPSKPAPSNDVVPPHMMMRRQSLDDAGPVSDDDRHSAPREKSRWMFC